MSHLKHWLHKMGGLHRSRSSRPDYWVWSLAALLTMAMLIWMLLDGRFYCGVPAPLVRFHVVSIGRIAIQNSDPGLDGNLRAILFGFLVAATSCLLIGIGVGLVVGAPAFRSVRSIFGMTTIIACWIFLGQQCESIVEFGRKSRLSYASKAIDNFAVSLDARWNELCDSTREAEKILGVDCSHAYPTDSPSMCFFPKSVPIKKASIEIVSIERTEGEAIRLQLAGANRGYWIERRFSGSPPQPFSSGLDYLLTPESVAKIGRNLYLVRYRD